MIPLLDFPGRQGQWPLGFPLLDFPGVQVNGPWVSLRAQYGGQGGEGGDQEQEGGAENKSCQDVSKWLKWKLGRRPGHGSIWTVFVSDGYDLFPSFAFGGDKSNSDCVGF